MVQVYFLQKTHKAFDLDGPEVLGVYSTLDKAEGAGSSYIRAEYGTEAAEFFYRTKTHLQWEINDYIVHVAQITVDYSFWKMEDV